MAENLIDIVLEAERQLRNDKIRADVVRWANIAQREICAEFSWPFTEFLRSTPSKILNPNYYTLPTDFRLPKSVRFEISDGAVGKLIVVTSGFEDDANPDQKGADGPVRAIFTGGLLLLRPGAKDATGKILLRYYRRPPVMKFDGDVPLVPQGDSDIITLGTIATGAKWLFSDKGDQDRRRQEFHDGLVRMIRNHFGHHARSDAMPGADRVWARMMQEDGGSV